MPPEEINAKLDQITDRLARIEALMETEAQRCPYRETIARAANNIKRMEALERTVDNLRLKIAGWAGFAGVVAAVGAEIVRTLLQ